jgi:hypothetical protein
MLLALTQLALAGNPALVTTARGSVTLVHDEATSQPAAPYVLAEGQALQIPEGSVVVVLFEGAAVQVTGPARLDHSQLSGASASSGGDADLLASLVTRGSDTRAAGATRSGEELTLSRPLALDRVGALQELAWTCADCGEQTVEIHSFMDEELVWSGAGTDRLIYGGPALEPGPYTARVGEREFAFKVLPPDDPALTQARQLSEAVAGSLTADQALEAEIGIYATAGLLTEALWRADRALATLPEDAELKALRDELETRAGLK